MTWAPDQPRTGFWMIRVIRNGPLVAARIYMAHTTKDPVSGEPMDRSPFLAAQIGLDIVDWRRVWECVEFCESDNNQRQALAFPEQSSRSPRNGRKPALVNAPLAKWQQLRAHRITQEQYEVEQRWLLWAATNVPSHPDFNYKRAIDRKAVPVPRFAGDR